MITFSLMSKSIPEWNVLLLFAKQITGRSISNTIETKKINKDEKESVTQAYYECLCELFNDKDSGKGNVNNKDNNIPSQVISHIYYSFYFVGLREDYIDLYNHTQRIKINVVETIRRDCLLGIATGSLKDWKEFIVDCSDGDEAIDIREFANRLQNYFEYGEGLYKVFTQYNKTTVPDGTFLLK